MGAAVREVAHDFVAITGEITDAAWADYDNDGDKDIAVNAGGRARLFRNNSGFSDVSDSPSRRLVQVSLGPTTTTMATWIFHLKMKRIRFTVTWKRIVHVAASLPVFFKSRQSGEAAWADYDNDGDRICISQTERGQSVL